MGDWLLMGILEVFLQGTLRVRVGQERRTIGGGIFCWVQPLPLRFQSGLQLWDAASVSHPLDEEWGVWFRRRRSRIPAFLGFSTHGLCEGNIAAVIPMLHGRCCGLTKRLSHHHGTCG